MFVLRRSELPAGTSFCTCFNKRAFCIHLRETRATLLAITECRKHVQSPLRTSNSSRLLLHPLQSLLLRIVVSVPLLYSSPHITFLVHTNKYSIQPSRMHLSQPMPQAAIPSTTTCSSPSSVLRHGTWLANCMADSGPRSSSFRSPRFRF